MNIKLWIVAGLGTSILLGGVGMKVSQKLTPKQVEKIIVGDVFPESAYLISEKKSLKEKEKPVQGYMREAQTLKGAGKYDEAKVLIEKAIAIREYLTEAEPDNIHQKTFLSTCYSALGDVFYAQEKYNEAKRAYQTDLKLAHDVVTMRPNRDIYKRDISAAQISLARLAWKTQDLKTAKDLYKSVIRRSEKILANAPKKDKLGRDNYIYDLAQAHEQLGQLFTQSGDLVGAQKAYESTIFYRKTLTGANEQSRIYIQSLLYVDYRRLGFIYKKQEKMELAHNAFMNSAEILGPLAKGAPKNKTYAKDMLTNYLQMYLSGYGDTQAYEEKWKDIAQTMKE